MKKKADGHGQETGPSSEVVLVRALLPLWAGWELIEPGTVYEQPVEAARGMAALGLVELVDATPAQAAGGFDTAQTPTQPTEAD